MRPAALAIAIWAFAAAAVSGQKLKVEHALSIQGGKPNYTPRGTLSYSSNSATFEQVPLTDAEATALKTLVEENGLYYVRVTDEAKSGHPVSSIVRACTLVSSKLKDKLEIHFGDGGEVVGIEYAPSNRTCANKLFLKKIQNGSTFKTTVKIVQKGLVGPSPVIEQKVIEEQTVEYDEEGKPIPKQAPQEQSFFQKYWMYIIPGLVLFNVMGGAGGQQQQQGGEGQQGAQQGGGGGGSGGGNRK